MSDRKTKRVVAQVFGTMGETVRVNVPIVLWDAKAGIEISPGYKLCGWYRGQKWGVVRTYSFWDRGDGLHEGDLFTAYRLDIDADREAFERFVASYEPLDYTTPSGWKGVDK